MNGYHPLIRVGCYSLLLRASRRNAAKTPIMSPSIPATAMIMSLFGLIGVSGSTGGCLHDRCRSHERELLLQVIISIAKAKALRVCVLQIIQLV